MVCSTAGSASSTGNGPEKLDLMMRQEHRAGEKAVRRLRRAGRRRWSTPRPARCARRRSSWPRSERRATPSPRRPGTQTLPDWTASHVRAFEFLRRVSRARDPGQIYARESEAPHRYEPDLNPTYHDLAHHYGVAVLPARVRRPRDKAKAEVAVQVVERWILAALRHRTFFSLAELNAAVARLLDRPQHTPVPQASRVAALAVRADRPAGAAPAAVQPVRLRRVEDRARAHRLPRGNRRALLFGFPTRWSGASSMSD